MKEILRKFALPMALALGIMLWGVPRTAAYQQDRDDNRNQAQDQDRDDARRDQGARDNQQEDRNRSYGMQRNDDQRGNLAGDYGYQDGLTQGMHDRQAGHRRRPDDDPNYKRADRGYESKFGDHDSYRQTYRSAYQRGYDRGYNGNGYNQQDLVNDRNRQENNRRDSEHRQSTDHHDNDDQH